MLRGGSCLMRTPILSEIDMAMRPIREFISLEAISGILLFSTAVLALFIDNSSFASYYESFFQIKLSFSVGDFILEKPLLQWINDGFMTLFFLLVGLEIKRELVEGELNSLSKASLPLIAAAGGMLLPALFYFLVCGHDPVARKGWAIPMATDTAFSLGILSLLGKRIPDSLKIFLTALAIFDDIGAIIVMAIFYTSRISVVMLLCALLFICILMLLNLSRVQRLGPYGLVGLLLWLCLLQSGVHATLAGIIIAMTIPIRKTKNELRSPLHWLEYKLHRLVAFGVLPLFAFANAGVSLNGLTFSHLWLPIPLGIACGLFFGKQFGIWLATMCGVKLGVSRLPAQVTPLSLYGLSLVAGVGFTMSLFIGTLAFHSVAPYAAFVRMGVIFGSFFSGILGYLVLRYAYPA
jgi:NhaA family Na+:H+ antiporter